MSASHISSELHNQTQAVLRIHLLGPSTVLWNDQSLHIPRRMVRALLYRLAYSEQSVTRQHLHLLFWPDHPEEIARRNLSHHLTHLRKSIPCPHALVSRGDQICLNRDFVLCDVVQFKQVMMAENRDIADIQKPIDEYHGPLLEGFDLPGCAEFEHWTIVERNSLERLYLEGLTFLVDQLIDQGSISEAIRYAQRYLETEELSEQMHCILIELLAAKGDRRAALDQFEICTALLERELGVDPLPETRAVYQAVLTSQSRFPQAVRIKPSPDLPVQKMPLVGRSQMMWLLDSLLSECQEQGGRVVLISGEAGIGKSRLMQEFADQY
ncbi:MAG: BTAD domain-containing putative transcriptional regulator, partial [Anaerolineales bacterium]